jgi:2-oxoglutarate ferredoxin oxidoreductase subunit alpha
MSLKQEGISYLAGAELPAVIVNIMRGGPGLGNISPSQSDYFQATKGGGHGDYHSIVLAPSCVQEAYELMFLAFDLADKYRNPVIILGDGLLGQMMEPIRVSGIGYRVSGENRTPKTKYRKEWALTGCKGRAANMIRSLYINEGELELVNLRLQKKYKVISNKEQHWESLFLEDSQVVVVAYGTMARIARSAVKKLREKNIKAGLIRPVTLWPFPNKIFKQLALKKKKVKFLVTEMSYGQMIEDVKLAINCKFPVEFLGRAGGGITTEEDIIGKIRRLMFKV